jgi:bifunctional DNA-binding transcriptional regulator/antitoxin component of YhaV-PrlF toxin-antitoxin module
MTEIQEKHKYYVRHILHTSMLEYEITKLSTKGQIVVPSPLRKDFKVGEKFLVIRNKNTLVFRRLNGIDKKLKEDLDFAKKTDKALLSYEKGEFKKKNAKDFLEELERW